MGVRRASGCRVCGRDDGAVHGSSLYVGGEVFDLSIPGSEMWMGLVGRCEDMGKLAMY